MFIPLLGDVQLLYPSLLWGLVGAFLLLLALLVKDFVKLPLTPEEAARQRRLRVWTFITRFLVVALVLLVLAAPYVEETKEVKGNPRLTLLVDTSASMKFFDTTFVDGLTEQLKRRVPTTVRTIGANLTSDVGSALLRNLEPGGNVLLVSDGNVNDGASLSDVAFYAGTQNATVSALNLSALEVEAAVTVNGAANVVAESDATYTVTVSATDQSFSANLVVSVDGAQVFNKVVTPGTYEFTQQFTAGEHRIDAVLEASDVFAENNAFRKSVHALAKPKVLLVTQKSSPVELSLRDLYDVEKKDSLPTDLSPYYAIIVNDAPVERLRNTQALHEYLLDEKGGYYGGGLVFFGGLNSFDRGGYGGSSLQPLLPVRVGKGERKKGDANLVFIIDISGSTARTKYKLRDGKFVAYNETVSTLDVIKAQVINAVKQLKIENRVGIIIFGVPPNTDIEGVKERIAASVRVLAPLDYLYNNRQDIVDTVPRVIGGGPTAADVAFRGAVEMLKNVQGDKNIILMTDGRYSAGLGAESPMKRELLNLAANAKARYGINFMTIGTGTSTTSDEDFQKKVDEAFLKDLARAGDGTYDRATQLRSLLVKWGDPKAKEYGDEFTLVPLSLTHFITRGVEPTAVLNAYAEVVPKDTAEMLIATDSGEPALTVWRYGNGRVATWTVYSGSNLGQLLTGENSLLLSRTVNWAIGDPQRKEPYYVHIPDTRTNEEGVVEVKSDSTVQSEALTFTKQGDTYTASFPPGTRGFHTLLGTTYAVNAPSEYDRVGLHSSLKGVVESTGGKVFKPSDDDAIVELVKEASRTTTLTKVWLATPFLVAAIILFLLEIGVRRLTERRRQR